MKSGSAASMAKSGFTRRLGSRSTLRAFAPVFLKRSPDLNVTLNCKKIHSDGKKLPLTGDRQKPGGLLTVVAMQCLAGEWRENAQRLSNSICNWTPREK